LQPLVSKDGLLTAYPPTNSLVVVDAGANVDRLAGLLSDLDVPSSERATEVVALRFAGRGHGAAPARLGRRPGPPRHRRPAHERARALRPARRGAAGARRRRAPRPGAPPGEHAPPRPSSQVRGGGQPGARSLPAVPPPG